ncbi:AraC family transcriptional regulator [Spirosoma montaniterrae]|uniref:AraC family transcriptional regulator n=1 Tax=Spirosoma montaniterrae TaxID=1178516 RepID=A0A1P9WRT3_9BACT|nr:AraC family transcriptional regulator [Spirosoma montaniterrae]AQG78071.1 AraC family transcriptional regulator [Spirosoma montaniterrae]
MKVAHTLSVATVNLMLFAARQRGADPDALIQTVGLTPGYLRHPDNRISIRQMHDLWREAIAATGDNSLPLKLGELVSPMSVGVLAYVMMHSPTLGAALNRLFQYQDLVCEGIRTTGKRTGNQFALLLDIVSPDVTYPDYALNSELSVYQSAMRALTGQRLVADTVQFSYPHPADVSEHERVFGPAEIGFDTHQTAYIFDASLLNLPVLNANPGLFTLFEQHAGELLQRVRTLTLRERVRAEIVTLLKGEEPTLVAIADRLAMGVRTLQLHLKGEGTTYQQELDDVRKELAVRHLREPNLSLTDVCYLLGFSEPSVFFRSFKKWTGQTPGEFRAAYL